MVYSKVEYYENGNIKSIEAKGIFLDFDFEYPVKGDKTKKP